jgi:hypothetical protein
MKHAILSEEVKRLIDRRPPGIIRNGNLFFVVLLAGIVVGSWWIRVPAVVRAPLQIRLKDGRVAGQMRVAGATAVRPGQKVIILGDDPALAHLGGSVEGVSRFSSGSGGDSCLIDVRLWGARVSPRANFSTPAQIVMEDERLFDRLRGMARLWHR